jgi:glycosyltransferase involved in cell wall biosynthesis
MIPRIIHQIWVGDKRKPQEWMNTWKDKHPEWEYILWDEDNVVGFENQELIDYCIKSKKYHGAADLIRYEVLYRFGGFVAPADSICINPIDDLLDNEVFVCYQNEERKPGLISPHIGCTKGNALMRQMIDLLKEKKSIKEPWIETGNLALTNQIKKTDYPVKIYPSYYFIPVDSNGKRYSGNEKIYAEHKWFTTKALWQGIELGIVTVVFNGYGKFLKQWLEAVAKVKPTKITIVAYDNPGIDEKELEGIDAHYEIIYTEPMTQGAARNLGIKNTPTEWILYSDVDDIILPAVKGEIEKHRGADILSVAYTTKTEDEEYKCDPGIVEKRFILGKDFYTGDRVHFYTCFSPFKKSIWEKCPYIDDNFPNAPFWIDLALSNAKFENTDTVCAIYNLRKDGHSNTVQPEEKNKMADKIIQYKKEERGVSFSIFSVVKNEEKLIEGSLKSMVGADEIVIIDTGSTDRTIEIAKKYTDKIYTDYKWNDNFAEAKNYALSKCSGDWIMGLDADCRLEEGAIPKIREAIAKTDKDILDIRIVADKIENRDKSFHWLPKIFKKSSEIEYVGSVHEYPARKDRKTSTSERLDVAIVYLYSENHFKDPDRNLRILLKEVEKYPQDPRWKFYLGREYWEREKYIEAIWWMKEYLKISHYVAEMAEAYLVLAKCYWQIQMGEDARMMCSHAIRFNPDFEEALRLMAEMHYEPRKSRWLSFAKIATNQNVLFTRSKN